MFKLSFIMAALLCSSALSANEPIIYKDALYQQQKIAKLTTLPDSLNFMVIGDWGHNGHFYQKEVAHQLEIAMYQTDADFIVSTGDNFYPNGVASAHLARHCRWLYDRCRLHFAASALFQLA